MNVLRNRRARSVGYYLVLIPILGAKVAAQTAPATVLTIEMENVVQYQENFANQAKNGTSTAQESPISRATFAPAYFIADIVAVNGRKAKGTTVARNYSLQLNPNPSSSQAIADINRFEHMDIVMEIQQADGSGVGSFVLSGLSGGGAPSGMPKSAPLGNFAVVGGTGAYYGVRGQAATISNIHRMTSTFENPLNRRNFGGGKWQLVIQLMGTRTPEVMATGSSPAIVHAADSSLVSTSKPARAGEILILYAAGLGPTRPGVDPGQPFPSEPVQLVSSPVEVLVNGKSAQVLYAGGYPGATDNYQVNFRVPDETAAGSAAIQLSAAWVLGSEVRIPMQ